jgi:hypothetical protein
MSYQEKVNAFARFGMQALDLIANENSELFLSIDRDDAFSKVAALSRLRANDLKAPNSAQELKIVLARLLGELLAAGKIGIKNYGLSILGQEELRNLIAFSQSPIEVDPWQNLDADAYRQMQPLEKARLYAHDPRFAAATQRLIAQGAI